jgi:hypothetical protein
VLHFRKLGQQRKTANENESSRPFMYSKSKEGTSSFDASQKQVHNIDSNGCGPPENWGKNSDLRGQKATTECTISGEIITNPGAATQAVAATGAEAKIDISIACFTKETLIIAQGTVPSS